MIKSFQMFPKAQKNGFQKLRNLFGWFRKIPFFLECMTVCVIMFGNKTEILQ